MERLPSSRNLDPAGIAVGLAAIGPGIGQGQAAAYLDEANRLDPGDVASNPRLLLLSFAFMESLCIYGLVIALAILFANQCTLVSCTSVCALHFRLTATFRRWAAKD